MDKIAVTFGTAVRFALPQMPSLNFKVLFYSKKKPGPLTPMFVEYPLAFIMSDKYQDISTIFHARGC
jgi:hypothetical protein